MLRNKQNKLRLPLIGRRKVVTGFALLSVLTMAKVITFHTFQTPYQYLVGRLRGINEDDIMTDSVDLTMGKETHETPHWITKLPGGGVRLSKELEQELERRLKAATEKKIILVWFANWGEEEEITINRERCGNCEGSYDRSKINDGNVGAVVFHFTGIRPEKMPPQRNPKHLYVFWTMESPSYLKLTMGRSLEFETEFRFNATKSYRRDSEFYESEEFTGTVESIVQNNNFSLQDILDMKTKLALATVSNCDATHGAKTRLRMLKELIALNFSLDAYGRCFLKRFGPHRMAPIFNQEVRKYKFYFAFENARHCKDYITEKFFNNALVSLAVPVVWGPKKEDYYFVAPPGSFVYAEDFPSMKALSEYLMYLDGNDTAYLEYFKWLTMKPSDMPQYARARNWCHICRALHGINIDDVYNPKFDENNLKRPLFTDGVAERTVENLIDWYYGEDNLECFNKG